MRDQDTWTQSFGKWLGPSVTLPGMSVITCVSVSCIRPCDDLYQSLNPADVMKQEAAMKAWESMDVKVCVHVTCACVCV